MPPDPDLRLATDIGGTFTDTVLVRGTDVLATAKTLTTHDRLAGGALEGARSVLAEARIAMSRVARMIHGTTLATNALIEKRGAKTACITTQGFRDILEIGYERRYAQYDINLQKPDLLVPRSRCFTVPERVSVTGEVLAVLDEAAADALAVQLHEVEAVAICLLHAYANPVHERRLAALLADRLPHLSVSVSHEVSPEAREFDRLCTTVANAYVQPLMDHYLADFEQAFRDEGLGGPILMMTAGGGMTDLATARRLPVRLVESGPAGGAILAARVAQSCGTEQVLSFDMGGTTAKLCLIDAFRPQASRQLEIARAARFIKGSGMPVRIPVIDLIEIGAGGGSVARVNHMGRLTVGPESAGSDPGPAGFARGGQCATVTDADIVSGYILPERFAEGRLAIDAGAAGQALDRDVGQPLGLDPSAAATGLSEIVDENMAAAARMHAVESGKDLGARTMIAFGGNGPLHATRVARRAGVAHVIVPPDPGVGSAMGFLAAPIGFEIVRSRLSALDELDTAKINALFDEMLAEAARIVRAGSPDGPLTQRRTAFMRYRGQGHEIEIALPDEPLGAGDIASLKAAFDAEYARQFTRTVPGMTIEILNWALRLVAPVAPPEPALAIPDGQTPAPLDHRRITCDVTGQPVLAPVHWRSDLSLGAVIAGPALIVEPQTTTLVSADFVARLDDAGNLHLTRSQP